MAEGKDSNMDQFSVEKPALTGPALKPFSPTFLKIQNPNPPCNKVTADERRRAAAAIAKQIALNIAGWRTSKVAAAAADAGQWNPGASHPARHMGPAAQELVEIGDRIRETVA